MERVCVFAGSSPGARPEYAAAARELGRELAARGIGLVYGGGNVGLMGALADAVMADGGEVIGVIPDFLLAKEVAHESLVELRVVGSMHERKALMAELAQGFIALPGGMGTFEELLEIMTWAQLGLHRWPCGVINVCGYYDALLAMMDHAVAQRFVKPVHRDVLLCEATPVALLDRFAAYAAPQVDKWLDRATET